MVLRAQVLGTASGDKTVRIWEVATGKQLSQLTGHTDCVTGVCFDPTGKTIVSCSRDKTIRFWDSATGAAIGSPVRGGKKINSVAFSPDGSLIAAGDGDFGDEGTIRLYNAATGDPFGSPLNVDAGEYGVLSVSFSPKGDMVAAGCYNGKIHFMDAAAGQIKSSVNAHSNWVRAVAWSPCGQWLASGGDDKMGFVFDTKTFEVKWPLSGHRFFQFPIFFSILILFDFFDRVFLGCTHTEGRGVGMPPLRRLYYISKAVFLA